jgi:RNA polymerase sigma factor (sigma-70 family)
MNSGNDFAQDLTRQLIELCYKNDKKAQLQLYNMYAKAMYNVCLNIVHQSENAEDIMQEAFISAFRNIQTFKGEVSFGAWLKKITTNKCIDFLKLKRQNFESVETLKDLADDVEDDDNYIVSRKIEEIKNTAAKLPEGYRTILSLHLFEGYDHDEIAQILNISASTSRSQFTRAKALLLKKLNECRQ